MKYTGGVITSQLFATPTTSGAYTWFTLRFVAPSVTYSTYQIILGGTSTTPGGSAGSQTAGAIELAYFAVVAADPSTIQDGDLVLPNGTLYAGTGSIQNLATNVLTGATGSFQNLAVNTLTGGTGSFSYLSAPQLLPYFGTNMNNFNQLCSAQSSLWSGFTPTDQIAWVKSNGNSPTTTPRSPMPGAWWKTPCSRSPSRARITTWYFNINPCPVWLDSDDQVLGEAWSPGATNFCTGRQQREWLGWVSRRQLRLNLRPEHLHVHAGQLHFHHFFEQPDQPAHRRQQRLPHRRRLRGQSTSTAGRFSTWPPPRPPWPPTLQFRALEASPASLEAPAAFRPSLRAATPRCLGVWPWEAT